MFTIRTIEQSTETSGADIRDAAVVEALAWGHEPTPAQIEPRKRRLAEQLGQDRCVLVAVSDDLIVGVCRAMPDPERAGTWIVYGLAVHPEHRRQGIGTALYRACVDAARTQGAKAVRSQTHLDNLASQAFHESLGLHGHHATAPDGDEVIAYDLRF